MKYNVGKNRLDYRSGSLIWLHRLLHRQEAQVMQGSRNPRHGLRITQQQGGMVMEWKSNAHYGKDPSEGTIFESFYGVSVHRIVGICGWWLTCHELNITKKRLSGETFDEAVKEAKEIVKKTISDLQQKYAVFADDSSENVMVKWFSR